MVIVDGKLAGYTNDPLGVLNRIHSKVGYAKSKFHRWLLQEYQKFIQDMSRMLRVWIHGGQRTLIVCGGV